MYYDYEYICFMDKENNKKSTESERKTFTNSSDVIRHLRGNNTLRAFSGLIKPSYGAIGDYERGIRNISDKKLTEICDTCGFELTIKKTFTLTKKK